MEFDHYDERYNGSDFKPAAVYFLRKKYEKKELKLLGSAAGISVCLYIVISFSLSLLPDLFGFYDLYAENDSFFYGFNILSTVLSLVLPFCVMSGFLKKRLPVEVDLIPVKAPRSARTMLLAVLVGLGGCCIANFLSTYITAIIELLGVRLTSPDISVSTTKPDYFMYFLYVTLCAGLSEEVTMRGIIMQPLKKYGMDFAVGASSVIFGLLHCNLIQTPFAVMGGLVMGYTVIVSDSLWTSIIIHALFNGYSSAMGEVARFVSDSQFESIYYFSSVIMAAAGLIAFIFLMTERRRFRMTVTDTVLTGKEKVSAYFFNIPMFIALLFILVVTKEYISL